MKARHLHTFIIVIVASLFLTGCGTLNQQIINDARMEAQNVKEAQSFSAVVQRLDTPQKVYDWMSTNIVYRSDQGPEDEFRDAETTFKLGYGDCDDYAKFADYVLSKHGYSTTLVSIFTAKQGHTVCVWKDTDEKLNQLSNTGIQYLGADDLMSIADTVYPDWKVYSVYPSNEGTLRPAGR